MSPDTLEVVSDLLNQVVLPVSDPDFEDKARKLATAKREVAAMVKEADDGAGT